MYDDDEYEDQADLDLDEPDDEYEDAEEDYYDDDE
jgi:hypothetical protein